MSTSVRGIAQSFKRIRERGNDAVWISLFSEEEVIRRAKNLEDASGSPPLRGRTFAVKDNIDLAGLPTTAACPAFVYTPVRSAAVVRRLIEAGAVPVGKTNLDQ